MHCNALVDSSSSGQVRNSPKYVCNWRVDLSRDAARSENLVGGANKRAGQNLGGSGGAPPPLPHCFHMEVKVAVLNTIRQNYNKVTDFFEVKLHSGAKCLTRVKNS